MWRQVHEIDARHAFSGTCSEADGSSRPSAQTGQIEQQPSARLLVICSQIVKVSARAPLTAPLWQPTRCPTRIISPGRHSGLVQLKKRHDAAVL